MTAPIRIQLKRTKGWRMPPNTVSVARPTKWGNPFTFDDWPGADDASDAEKRSWCVGMYELRVSVPPEHLAKLRGKNLACWCKVGDPCHGDILLELANKETGK